MNDKIVQISDGSFEDDVIKAEKPVLVDFWAPWCGPCKMIAPLLDAIVEEYDGKITVAKMNVDDNNETPPKYGIRGIPTLLLFKDGNVVGTKVGALSKTQLTDFINENIG
ncbi:MAG: thioredoxin TrxA [Aestuariibacter sp.]